MHDPTVIILQVCFAETLVIFALAALIRSACARRVRAVPPQTETTTADDLIPASAGEENDGGQDARATVDRASCPDSSLSDKGQQASASPGPPPLPSGRVATWPYLRLDLLWMGFIFLTFFSLSIGTARIASEKTEITVSSQGLIQSICMQLFLAGMTAVVMLWRIRPMAWLGLQWAGWRWVFFIAPIAVAAVWMFSAALFAVGYMDWIESLGVEQVQDTVKLLQTNQDPLILMLMVLAAVVVAPFCEEIIFRGYLYPAAKKFAGPWLAGACSAMVFAAAHGSLSPLLPLFFFGCLLVLAYELTGSLWAPISMHFCFNAATVLIQVASRIHPPAFIPSP